MFCVCYSWWLHAPPRNGIVLSFTQLLVRCVLPNFTILNSVYMSLTVYLLLWWKAYLEPPEGIPLRVNLRATQQTVRAPKVLDNSSMVFSRRLTPPHSVHLIQSHSGMFPGTNPLFKWVLICLEKRVLRSSGCISHISVWFGWLEKTWQVHPPSGLHLWAPFKNFKWRVF